MSPEDVVSAMTSRMLMAAYKNGDKETKGEIMASVLEALEERVAAGSYKDDDDLLLLMADMRKSLAR